MSPPTAPYTIRHLNDVCGGDHVCYLCKSEEEKWRVLCQFFQVGLDNNEKVLFFQHSNPEAEVLEKLEKEGLVGLRECAKRGQFQVLHYTDVYLRDGRFSPEGMVNTLDTFTSQCITEGYSALRVSGDMSWVYKETNLTSKLIKYESMLNRGFPQTFVALCMYDTRAFKPSEMLQVLATHPQAVINEKLLQNIYYMPPDEYLGNDVDRAMLDRWMYNIEDRKNIEEQLIASRTDAQKEAHAKANFLATMSHEIRNPTNGIIGSAELLSQTSVSTEQNEYVSIIQASAKHLYMVVNDVLDLSKIESGKLGLRMAPLKVRDLIEDSRRLCEYSIQKNLSVSLRCEVDPTCPESIVGDETRLRQILVNLIGNACKFTDEGEVLVSVVPITSIEDEEETGETIRGKDGKEKEQKKVEYDGSCLEFSVSDSGKGISEEDISKLFTKFTQVGVQQKWASTGLGLAICKQLVEAMGGKIKVKSTIGKGSTFYFRIPSNSVLSSLPSSSSPPSPVPLSAPANLSPSFPSLSSPSPSPDFICLSPRGTRSTDVPSLNFSPCSFSSSSPASPSLPSPISPSPSPPDSPTLPRSLITSPAFDFSDDHVLLVEDDITNQKVLSHMLRKLNCKVSIASNGLEAIDLVKDNDYSMIITDQYMPECDGFAAVMQIRAHFATQAPASPHSPGGTQPPASMRARRCPTIVVCTGTYEGRLTEVMDDILIKPVCFKTMSELLLRYCTNKLA